MDCYFALFLTIPLGFIMLISRALTASAKTPSHTALLFINNQNPMSNAAATEIVAFSPCPQTLYVRANANNKCTDERFPWPGITSIGWESNTDKRGPLALPITPSTQKSAGATQAPYCAT